MSSLLASDIMMEFQGMVMGQYVQSVMAGEPKNYLK
jgi:hypothetical protein